MSLSKRFWRCFLAGIYPVMLVFVACSEPAPNTVEIAPADNLDYPKSESTVAPAVSLTFNVEISDDGINPSSIFIPVGRRVQIVLRNRGSTEHHYRIQGLVPSDLLWLSRPSDREEGFTDEEHESHHDKDFVPYRARSKSGIWPLGEEVHAYAESGGVDIVLFTPTSSGRFLVDCPLHHKVAGMVDVF
ncbi:MAG: hypothetical protein HQ475_03390 [SAR202 cluster bacterium]|nr:hypothetical protein [SAR202 cluster bacterium]